MEESESYHKITQEADDTYSTDYGWGLYKEESDSKSSSKYRRTYTWNERNQLISSVDSSYSTAYVYGQDGQRANKYTQSSETLYFNKMWTLHTDSGNSVYGGQTAKNIYLGETRIVTKLNGANDPTYQEEYYKQYFYHSDHLGSASLISDYNGDEYQRIEYTPYGETWVEKTNNTGMEYLPYKFTGKEMDEETGLYYYGARYLDPKYSMWISTDPALGEYIPIAPTNDEAKKHNSNLPGMGGVFNHINFNLYHYAGNSPVKYTDPDGNEIVPFASPRDFFGFLKSIASGQDKVYAGCIEKACLPKNEPCLVNMTALINKLEKLQYQGESSINTPSLSSMNSVSKNKSILLESNILENFACALPLMTDATMADIDTESIHMGPSVGPKMSATTFGLGLVGNMARGISNIYLNYVETDGKVTSWSISKTGLNPQKQSYSNMFSKTEALEFLKKNSENSNYYDSKELKKINDAL